MNNIQKINRYKLDFSRNGDGSYIDEEHKCKNIAEVCKSDYDNIVIARYQDIWCLVREQYADEQAIKNGRAEELGEDITEAIGRMRIQYCPYCGKLLLGNVLFE